MSVIIDQTWVYKWCNEQPPQASVHQLTKWLREAPDTYRSTILQFPPLCMICGRGPMEVPYAWSVGLVSSYYPDGRVGVRQSPDAQEVPVDPSNIFVVGFRPPFTPDTVQQLFCAGVPW